MTRRGMLHLPALLGTLAAAVLLACAAAALLAVSEKAEATFPGKNRRIAYAAWEDVGAAEPTIYTINPGGGANTKLTSGYQPSYSPDGKKIVYTAFPVFFGGDDHEVYTIKVDGSGKTRLTNDNTDESDPSYSPDGKKIVYSSTTYFRRALPKDEIYTVNVGGGAKTKVTNGSGPVYSPDGKRIVFYARDKSSPIRDTEIYTIKVDGSGKTQITHNNKDEFTPDYSPDGKRIVFAGLAGLERNDAESDIYTIKAGGGGKTQVTNTDNVDDLHPVYSPDGKKIVYTVYKGNAIKGDVYTINVGGGGKFRVTHGKLQLGGPAWGRRP